MAAKRDFSEINRLRVDEERRHHERMSNLDDLRYRAQELVTMQRNDGVVEFSVGDLSKMHNEGIDPIGALSSTAENLKRPFVYIMHMSYRHKRLVVPNNKWCEGLVSQFHIIARQVEPQSRAMDGIVLPDWDGYGVYDASNYKTNRGKIVFHFYGEEPIQILGKWLAATKTETRYRILLKTF